jgi:hypothetical protein
LNFAKEGETHEQRESVSCGDAGSDLHGIFGDFDCQGLLGSANEGQMPARERASETETLRLRSSSGSLRRLKKPARGISIQLLEL